MEKMIKIIDRPMAEEIYDFITSHLDVVNDYPYVEQFMQDLETTFNLELRW